MPLTLRLVDRDKLPIELDGFLPASLSNKSVAEIERMPAWQGNRQVFLGDVFHVSGSPADETVRLEGDLSHVHHVGAGMTSGRIVAEGNVGLHAGAQMSGGTFTIHGSAGDWLGAQMRGGTIHCQGSAGDGLGAAYPGTGRGMAGGSIVVDGGVGSHAGRRMRRGVIAVGGSASDCLGAEMLAGTIVVQGDSGACLGDAMRRGTLIVLGKAQITQPRFQQAGRQHPTMLRLLARHLQPMADWAGALAAGPFNLYHGDMLQLGRGELFARV